MVERDKIGFISVPWSGVPSNRSGSMGIMADQVSRRLPSSCQAVVVSGTHGHDPALEADGVKYHRILDRTDRYLFKTLSLMQNFLPGFYRNYHFRSYFHRSYIQKPALFREKRGRDERVKKKLVHDGFF